MLDIGDSTDVPTKARLWLIAYNAVMVTVLVLGLILTPLHWLLDRGRAAWFLRRCWPKRVRGDIDAWFHGVSLGELKVVLELTRDWPERQRQRLLVTTSTINGWSFLTQSPRPFRIALMPFDLAMGYNRLLYPHRPHHLILVETEIWPNLLNWARSKRVGIVFVNGRLGESTARLARNALVAHLMRETKLVCVRSEEDAQRFKSFGIAGENVEVTGNMKYDYRPGTLGAGPLRTWLQRSDAPIIFASISTDECANLASQAIKLAQDGHRILWAPRQLSDLNAHLDALTPANPELRSRLQDGSESTVLVLDTFGELASCYAWGRLTVMGGSFNRRGGQNFLESLQAGTPVVIGPYTENFAAETREARARDALVVVPAAPQVGSTCRRLLTDTNRLVELAQNGKAFLQQHQGAIARTNQQLLDLGIDTGIHGAQSPAEASQSET